MKPDRSNYEIWLIDWLDGKLDEIQVRQLLSFLDKNPDLKEEFHSCSDIILNPPSEKFLYKNLLQKELSDITDKQFKYLCAGYVEDDLSGEQIEELKEIISTDITKKTEFEFFKQTKLTAPDIRFANKRKLLRTTPFQKVLRISAAALSAAASIAIFIVASQFFGKNDLSVNNLSQLSEEVPVIIAPETVSDSAKNIIILTEKIAEVINQPPKEIEKDEKPVSDSTLILPQRNYLEPVEIPDMLSINIYGVKDYQNNILALSKTISDTPYSDMRVSTRNLAQLFREKALKEEIPDNSPIKPYEFAMAGINGLNRLFNWEMDFRKKLDENGEIKSIYFGSRLLTAQIPVNRSE